MSAPSSSFLSQFVDNPHLWDFVILFLVLGVYHFLTITILHGFRFMGEINEAYYAYKARCVENRRRYEQVAREPDRAFSHHAGGD
jgi:hypothetical protein